MINDDSQPYFRLNSIHISSYNFGNNTLKSKIVVEINMYFYKTIYLPFMIVSPHYFAFSGGGGDQVQILRLGKHTHSIQGSQQGKWNLIINIANETGILK